MSLEIDGTLTPWIGAGYRHMNASRGQDVLDLTHVGKYGLNRRNVPGEPTLYLAGDIGVAIAERTIRALVSHANARLSLTNHLQTPSS